MKKKPDNQPKQATDPSTDSTSSPQVNSRLRQGSGGQAGQDLRRQAEAKLSERLSAEQAGKKKATALPATESDTRRLVYELEVHQIELEIQNEELLQSHAQVEAGLRQYTDLYDFAPVGYFTLARDGAIHQVNLVGANLLGVKHGALIKRRFGVFISARSRTTFSAFLEKVFSTSGSKETCEVALQKDGSDPLWVHIKAIIEDGQREACRAVVVDITARKRAEEALQESESQFRELWGATVEGITILDKGIIVEVNDAMCQMFGYMREQVIGKSLLEFTPIEMHESIQERIVSGIEGRFETPALRADGVRIILEAFAKQFVYQGKSLRLVTTRDITERKWAEEALAESEERFSRLTQASFEGIIIYDKGRILDANQALADLFGYELSEIIGMNVLDIAAPESRDLVRNNFLIGYEKPYEAIGLRKDGTTFVGELRGRQIPYREHMVRVTAIRDITERRQMEEGLRQMQKLEGLGTLAGGIAHDFNNILGIILAYITSTHRFKDDTKKLDLAVNTIVKAVERGKTLVNQILAFARKTETAFGAVDVNDVVMEIMTMIFETFPKILTYSQNFDKSVPYINADRSQLHQVLMNLCVNARDAMPESGVLTINTRMISVVSLRNQHPDAAASSYVCIEVSDTGEGMTEEIRKRIFEPFFTTKGIGKGTGLGLSVVFGVVQTHKGFIDVESELGKGTTFRLYLPASQVAAPISVKDEETLEEIPGGTETVLVVEDEEMLMMSLRIVLVEKGYKVLSAEDGLTALKIYQEKKNDIALVLTDLGLPNMTGLEVCQRIKKINPKEHMILATGFLDPEMKSEFLEAGIQNFLFKPYDLKQMLKVVRAVLDEK